LVFAVTRVKLQKKEVWVVIKGFPAYEVSNHGRVRSLDRLSKHGNYYRRLKGVVLSCKGSVYPAVTLWARGAKKGIKIRVHIIVAEHFLGKRPNWARLEVNHKNGNKWDSYYENLEWTTTLGNSLHARQNDLSKRLLSNAQIKEIRKAFRLHPYHGLGVYLSRKYKVGPDIISTIKLGRIAKDV
jgi:hypothetical protein